MLGLAKREVEPELPEGWLRLLRAELVVNLKSGEAIRGVLFDADDDFLTLRATAERPVQVLAPGAPARPLDGEAWVPQSSVTFIQKLGGG